MKEDIREKALEGTKEKLREEPNREKFMVRAVETLDHLEKDIEEEVERFRNWYSLHFPELEDEIGNDEQLIKILSKGLNRDGLESFSEMAESSTGIALKEEDEEVLNKVFENVQGKMELREDLEAYIEDIAEEETPNLEGILGPILTARLVSLAGGLEELAKKPASTVQMLGAEKALFRYLKGEGTPPKHGVLFEHRFVNSLPEDKRGKMARFLANKTAMAARIDEYGDKMKADSLREECREKFEDLKEE